MRKPIPTVLMTLNRLICNFSSLLVLLSPLCGPSSHPPPDRPGLSPGPAVLSVSTHFVTGLIWSCGFQYHRVTHNSETCVSIRDCSHELQTLLSNHLCTSPPGCLTGISNLPCLRTCSFHRRLHLSWRQLYSSCCSSEEPKQWYCARLVSLTTFIQSISKS